jgi:adenine/guanine phosphoribosyltransferase-like PRPP-binding protein
MKPPRVPLAAFPDVVIHADELVTKRHLHYSAAKGGEATAAKVLVTDLVNPAQVERLAEVVGEELVELIPVHALETEGVNEIPAALARELSRRLGFPVNRSIVQTNSVGHTSASGFERLARQAQFEGHVTPGQPCVIVDDFVGQGGTLANLIGYITSRGGRVVAATVLTGKPFSAMLAPDAELLQKLRAKHGGDFEDWWREDFGFGFDCLTRSEARYLEKSADADGIRNRIAAAGFGASPEGAGTG